MNLKPTIVPKSDQLNADDLIGGPITIRITKVMSGTAEQPVAIGFDGDGGRPYKPSKSMRRVLVTIWGDDGAAYIGKSCTLYRDPEVKFGGDPVGGVKISHASDINGPQDIMLTVSRGYRKPHRVDPLREETVTPVDLGELPPAWADWTTEERGNFMANQGVTKLHAWWTTLSKPDKKALESRLRNEWKPAAAATEKP